MRDLWAAPALRELGLPELRLAAGIKAAMLGGLGGSFNGGSHEKTERLQVPPPSVGGFFAAAVAEKKPG
jgi:hypothetical protein